MPIEQLQQASRQAAGIIAQAGNGRAGQLFAGQLGSFTGQGQGAIDGQGQALQLPGEIGGRRMIGEQHQQLHKQLLVLLLQLKLLKKKLNLMLLS